MTAASTFGEFEQLVLLAVLQAGERAFGIELRRLIAEDAGRPVSRGALYKTLERLCDKGLLAWEVSDSTPERGGLPRRRFLVTEAGVRGLRQSKSTLERFWAGLDEVLG